MKGFVVAIDGPAGAGKTATARGVADQLGLIHVDSGAMYRAVGWLAQRSGVPLDSEEALLRLIDGARIEAGRDGLLVDGVSVEPYIRTAEAGEAASRVAVHRGVRARLVKIQRSLGGAPGVVMEGRDIGTVVFPKADLKIFLTASVEARARRRFEELRARGERPELPTIEAAIRERDRRDSDRAASPLVPATDAIPLDTTRLSLEEQIDLAAHWARGAQLGPGGMTPFHAASRQVVVNFARLGLRYRVVGRERIPPKGPLIVACNHISFWDPPLVGAWVPRTLHYLAKQELFENRVFGAMLRAYNCIPIQRGPQARSALRGAEGVLDRGGAVLIFPEGTRSKSGSLLPPRAGISHLAAVARAPVVPARISGSNQIRRSMLRQVEIRLTFGSPMMPPVGAAGSREEGDAFARKVMDAIAALPAGTEEIPWK
ncbi:MAG TPA: (d)CMP kinase [Candidatus Eisenbacteria bacterium]|nr:(d)CMP kinase [Candidatus Eisenbacteria bacterium]